MVGCRWQCGIRVVHQLQVHTAGNPCCCPCYCARIVMNALISWQHVPAPACGEVPPPCYAECTSRLPGLLPGLQAEGASSLPAAAPFQLCLQLSLMAKMPCMLACPAAVQFYTPAAAAVSAGCFCCARSCHRIAVSARPQSAWSHARLLCVVCGSSQPRLPHLRAEGDATTREQW